MNPEHWTRHGFLPCVLAHLRHWPNFLYRMLTSQEQGPQSQLVLLASTDPCFGTGLLVCMRETNGLSIFDGEPGSLHTY